MKKKFFLGLVFLIVLFTITGCEKNKSDSFQDKLESSQDKSSSTSTEIKTKLSCYNEGYLFKSKKFVEHIMYLDKDNKLVEYEHIEKYFSFTDDNDFNMICEGSAEEEENNNKLYPYLKEVANCDRNSKEVTISDLYYINKLDTKSKLPSDELKNSLNDDYVLDINDYKNSINKKGYTCQEENK